MPKSKDDLQVPSISPRDRHDLHKACTASCAALWQLHEVCNNNAEPSRRLPREAVQSAAVPVRTRDDTCEWWSQT